MQRNRQALGVISTNNFNQLSNIKPQANAPLAKQAKPATAPSKNDENNAVQRGGQTDKTSQQEFSIYEEERNERLLEWRTKQATCHDVEKWSLEAEKSEEEDEDDEEIEDIPDSGDEDVKDEAADKELSLRDLESLSQDSEEMFQKSSIFSPCDLLEGSEVKPCHTAAAANSPMAVDEDDDDEESTSSDTEEEVSRKSKLSDQEERMMSCLEYKDDILQYMRSQELQNRPKANYMNKQQDINSSMRTILVDWLVEVCEEYRLNSETLYLAVNYTDRFLSQMSVLRGKLQLVGTASMYIASKYEEITPPDVSEFVYITDDTYTKVQVLRMEHLLLKVLDFKVTAPTANWFLNHHLRFAKRLTGLQHTAELERFDSLTRYLIELTLLDVERFLGFLPSQIAASAFYMALICLGSDWNSKIANELDYDLEDLGQCVEAMLTAMEEAPTKPQQAIYEKYKSAKYHHVSLTPPPSELRSSPK